MSRPSNSRTAAFSAAAALLAGSALAAAVPNAPDPAAERAAARPLGTPLPFPIGAANLEAVYFNHRTMPYHCLGLVAQDGARTGDWLKANVARILAKDCWDLYHKGGAVPSDDEYARMILVYGLFAAESLGEGDRLKALADAYAQAVAEHPPTSPAPAPSGRDAMPFPIGGDQFAAAVLNTVPTDARSCLLQKAGEVAAGPGWSNAGAVASAANGCPTAARIPAKSRIFVVMLNAARAAREQERLNVLSQYYDTAQRLAPS